MQLTHELPGQTVTAHPSFPSLETETRSHVTTACAAFHLTRSAQTLRTWACLENGPLRPCRVRGRLYWAVSDIKRVLNGETLGRPQSSGIAK
jgi:hypothetical protein